MSEQKAEQSEQVEPSPVDGMSDGAEKGEEGPVAADELVAAAELKACQEELAAQKDSYLRARADLENYRRRTQREKEELSKFANENILREILPVIDNLERAVSHARCEEADAAGLLAGVEMTLSQFQKVLEKFQVTVIEALNQPFDCACHEAMGQIENGECDPNTVVQELQRGYLLNGRLLRPALVMVSKAPAAPAPAETEA